MLLSSALLLVTAATATGPVADLDATLARFTAKEAVQAHFTVRYENVSGDGKDASQRGGEVSGEISEGASALALSWPRALVDQAREEDRKAAADPETKTPARDAIGQAKTFDLAGHLDAAAQLRQALLGATLVEDRQDALDGAPARLLGLKLDPVLSARDRKYVKELEATGKVWLGADGVPLAAEVRSKASGRAFLVITFSTEQQDSWRFEPAGDRLVAVRHEERIKSEGAGEKGDRKTITTLAVARPKER
jgi:hypothetical protein